MAPAGVVNWLSSDLSVVAEALFIKPNWLGLILPLFIYSFLFFHFSVVSHKIFYPYVFDS